MNKFVAGQKIRAQFPLRPDLHVDLVRNDAGWRRLDGLGPRVPYRDAEIERVPWSHLDDPVSRSGNGTDNEHRSFQRCRRLSKYSLDM